MDIKNTIDFIQNLHAGQYDWTGAPYWEHPVAVMKLLPDNSSLERKQIALLHDVLEDCLEKIAQYIKEDFITVEMGKQYLREIGFSEHVVHGVSLLTREEDGIEYIQQIQNIVDSGHLDAIWVKLCDNTHNTDPERISLLSDADRAKARRMGLRYERSKAILRQGIMNAIKIPFTYTNFRGETALRNVKPVSLRYGFTEFHPIPQWLMRGIDLDRNVEREFAYNDILMD